MGSGAREDVRSVGIAWDVFREREHGGAFGLLGHDLSLLLRFWSFHQWHCRRSIKSKIRPLCGKRYGFHLLLGHDFDSHRGVRLGLSL